MHVNIVGCYIRNKTGYILRKCTLQICVCCGTKHGTRTLAVTTDSNKCKNSNDKKLYQF